MTRPKRSVTGRLTSSKPNLQNIPIRTEEGRRIRDAFLPRVLVETHFEPPSTIETRTPVYPMDEILRGFMLDGVPDIPYGKPRRTVTVESLGAEDDE